MSTPEQKRIRDERKKARARTVLRFSISPRLGCLACQTMGGSTDVGCFILGDSCRRSFRGMDMVGGPAPHRANRRDTEDAVQQDRENTLIRKRVLSAALCRG